MYAAGSRRYRRTLGVSSLRRLWLGLCYGLLAGVAAQSSALSSAQSNAHIAPGHGAMSAQDSARWTAAQQKVSAGSEMQGMAMDATSGMASVGDPADAICPRYATGSTVAAPPELQSQNGKLEVTLKFLTTTDAQGLVRYCYVTPDGQEAPTLRVTPGDTLVIHFTNNLPASLATSMASANGMAGMSMSLNPATAGNNSPCTGTMSAAATNIHFHGLNVAPTCGQDEVVHTLVGAGQSFDYTVQIPANEPPGLYWYHPHPHGFSEGQVLGGATGVIIVEGLQSVVPTLASLPERTFVMRDQLLPTATASGTNPPAWDLSINYVPVTFPTYKPAVVPTNPNTQELWRIANTSADTILNLQYTIAGTAQTMQLVAMDGYPIAAGSSGQTQVPVTNIVLPPGARAEIVITTPNIGDTAQLITQYWSTGPDGDFDPTRPIANIVSSVGAEAAGRSTKVIGALQAPRSVTAAPARVTRFASLSTATPVAQRNLYFSEVLLDPANPLSPTTFFITEEGHTPAAFTMDQPPNITVHDGTVEDWVIQNRAEEDHIFHIHQLHFQVLEVNGVAVNDPAVRDTMDVPFWSGTGPYPSIKVRMDFRDPNIVGTFMYHCHILEHEDSGMMGEIQVLPAGTYASAKVSTSASDLTPNGNVTLSAAVMPAMAGAALPTGALQFQVDGENIGNAVTLVHGAASFTTAVNGNVGPNSLTAFYEGDASYTEVVSPAVAVNFVPFGLASADGIGALGSAVTVPVTVNVANNLTGPIQLTCTVPAGLTEAACFVNPTAVTATGQVNLTLNTTPSHPLASLRTPQAPGRRRFAAAGGAISLASLFCLFLPRCRQRRQRLGAVPTFLLAAATISCVSGCGAAGNSIKKPGQLDPGTPAGSYNLVVTGTSGAGTTAYTTTLTVPVTVK